MLLPAPSSAHGNREPNRAAVISPPIGEVRKGAAGSAAEVTEPRADRVGAKALVTCEARAAMVEGGAGDRPEAEVATAAGMAVDTGAGGEAAGAGAKR
jgi:hypothetical protein